jgi:predicted ATPase/DNA-binding CsgD family transcriptional regulator
MPTVRVVKLPVVRRAVSRAAAQSGQALFGRDADLSQLSQLLVGHQLVSIVGPGGVGKTSLARVLMQASSAAQNNDAYLVDLAPLAPAGSVVSAVIESLNISTGSLSPQAALVAKLIGRPVLLVLDNCEHVLGPAAELVAALLADLPELRVLVTSQEALKLHDERVYRLGTLAVPAPGASFDEARVAGAVALFGERARASDHRFVLSPDNIAAVAEICRQLDGVALAIELAAARVRLLGVNGVLARLGERLQLLTAGATDASLRHQTLLAALEWSYHLLTSTQQRAFRRLGVMSGSFSIAAALQVTGEDGAPEYETLETLAALLEKSLVVAEPLDRGEPRFRLLETMRLFALARLVDNDDLEHARERHLRHFLALAESARLPLDGPDQGQWLRRLDMDRENLFAAHRYCDTANDGAARGLRLVNALLRYWFNRGVLLHGQVLFEEATARPGAAQSGQHYARGLHFLGRLYAFRGLDQQVVAAQRRAIEAARRAGATNVLIQSLARLGYGLMGIKDIVSARTAMEEACRIKTGDGNTRAIAVLNLAELERSEGNFAAALPLYQESFALASVAGNRQSTMIALNNLAFCTLAIGDASSTVRGYLLDSLLICDELDSRRGRLVVMEAAAGLAAGLGQWSRAFRFDAATRLHTARMGRRRDVADEATLAPMLDRARGGLGDANTALAEAEGRALSYDAAVEDLREWLTTLPVESAPAVLSLAKPMADFSVTFATAPRRSMPAISPAVVATDSEVLLTPRERETLALIARGYDNRGVAELMGLSVLTVRTHRQRLMQKLQLHNAAEITAYAVRLGLYNPV